MAAMRAVVYGGSGYGGGEVLRLLAAHPAVDVARVAAHRAAGRMLGEVFPNLAGHPDAHVPMAPAEPDAADGCDVAFLATPVEASLDLAGPLLDAGITVVDLSAAYRLDAEDFAVAYGQPHPDPDRTPAPYGLVELFGDELPGAALIAVPGCYVTAASLALAALGDAVGTDDVVVTGMSGTSGAGRSQRDDLQASHAMGAVSPYGPARHRHAVEIDRNWRRLRGSAAPVAFTPHLVPMPRGLVSTVSVPLAEGATTAEAVHAHASERFAASPFVHVRPLGTWPSTGDVVGSNAAHLAVTVDPVSGRATASCAIDNLIKGAGGQAVQAANVALGLDEAAGLSALGVYP